MNIEIEALRAIVADKGISIETVISSGMFRASASSLMVLTSLTTSVPEPASPARTTGTSTVTFSPFFTTSRSACSM